MNKYENKENNCHYRDCEAITDNISRINLLSYPTSIGYLSRIKNKKSVMPKFCCKQNFQGIFELNKIIGRSLEKIFKKIFRDDSFVFGCAKLLTLAVVLSTSIISESWAATSGCDCGSEDNCCWKIEDGVLTIYPNPERSSTGNVTMKDFDWTDVGTDTANGYTSETSSNAPWQRQGVTSVVVENGISNIGANAFVGDAKITSVTGMENITSIGEYAFASATSLQSVNMPKVETIGDFAFFEASLLQSVDMPKVTSIGQAAFFYASSLQSVDMPKVTSIGEGAFMCASSLQSVDMPKVTSIGEGAFAYAASLAYVGLNPNGSVSIGDDAFLDTDISNCTGEEAYCGSCPDGQSVMPGRGCVANTQTESQGQQGQGDSQVSEQQGTQGSGQATSAADCTASGKYWQEGKCVSSCGASFKLNDGWCDRQRYTPAEAAAILNDDDNTITITFKK